MTKQELCDSFYQMDNVVTIDIDMPQTEWDELRNAEPEPDGRHCVFEYTGERYSWYTATSVEVSGTVFPEAGPHRFERVGIKKRSFCGSFDTEKPALALHFSRDNPANEDVIEDLIGTQHITLNNSKQDLSFIRQALGFELFKQASLPYSRCNFAHVNVNGTHIGFYVNLEPIKKRHIQHNFDDNDTGTLYEIEKNEDFIEAMMDRISWEGFNEDFTDKADLRLATQILTNYGVTELDTVIDLTHFLRYFAMEALLKHWDGYTRNLNNTYIYNEKPAVADPGIDDINFRFIPWGLDLILQEENRSRPDREKWALSEKSVLGRLVLNDNELSKKLNSYIRLYATSIFDRDNYNDVLLPFIAQMEDILLTHQDPSVSPHIATVRRQLKLVKSAGFQLIGELPGSSCHLIDKNTDKCAHASNSERVGEDYESYHRVPANRSDRWYIAYDEEEGGYTIRNRMYETYLHASTSIYTNEGHLNVYCLVEHPHNGNYFNIEPVVSLESAPESRRVTGYFKINSTRTGNYLHYSPTDLTPAGRTRINQSDADNASSVYLF